MEFLPDPAQSEVLEHVRGPLLATGGPGTGKTATLRERFARLLEGGTDPERTALVLPDRRARSQSRAALFTRLRSSLPGLTVVTVHGMAYRIVSDRHAQLDYERPPEVLGAADQASRVADLLAGERPEQWPAYGRLLPLRGFADQVRQFLLRAQEALLGPSDLESMADQRGLAGWRELADFYRRYLDVCYQQNQVDAAGLLVQAAIVAGSGEPPFDHVMIDDYQEATPATERLLSALRPSSLVVSGDPGSHVFSFRGTTDEPIRRFQETFPGGRIAALVTDHRAGHGVRVDAWSCPHTSEEHAAIARELRRVHLEEGIPWRELAVVVRRLDPALAGLLRALDDAAVPRGLPERELSLASEPAGHPFVLALRWLARPEDRDALVEPLLTSELAGLSPADARGLVRAARARGRRPRELIEGAPEEAAVAGEEAGLTPLEREAVRLLAGTLVRAEPKAARSVLDAFWLLWRELPYAKRLVRDAESSPRARRDLDAVVALSQAAAEATALTDPSVPAFLVMLEAGEAGPGVPVWRESGADEVQILTAHGTAGQEFDTVIVTGVLEGNFPSLTRPEPMFDLAVLDRPISQSERNRRRLDDERRLFHVVTTRARRRALLTASDPQAQGELAARSRFAEELGVAWSPAPAGPHEEPLTVAEAAATWRRRLADPRAPRGERLAALDGILALGQDPCSWWYQRDWTGTDRPLHEHLRVSHSKLDTLANCHLQYLLAQEIGLDDRAGYQAWVGHLVHRLIEDCEKGSIQRSEEALVAEAERRWQPAQFPSRAVSEAFRRLVTRVMLPQWFKEYGGHPAVAQELHFEFPFEDAVVSGYIDRVGKVDKGGSCITDYKTGKSRNAGKVEENLQLGIYYLAINRAEDLERFRPVKGVELVFLRDLDWRGGTIARAAKGFSAKDQSAYEEAIQGRLSELLGELRDLQTSENYRPSSTAECRFCSFKALCPIWPEGREVLSPMGRDRP